MPAHQGWP